LELILTGQNSQNFEEFFASQMNFDISGSDIREKNLAKSHPGLKIMPAGGPKDWYHSDFILGIQFLISSGVLVV